VILEAGAFGTSADWDYILDDLSKGGRVCAYDRAGIGRSPDRPGDRGVLAKAGELNGLLDQLGVTGKVILVGHSNGALYIEAFARLFPDRVAGLVYVNGVNGSAADDPLLLSDLHTERKLSDLAALAAHLGLAFIVADKLTGPEHLAPAAAARKREALDCARCLVVARDEDRLIVPGLDAVNRLDGEAVRHIPTVVISGSPYPKQRLAAAWRAAEIKPAVAADRSWILDAPGATHVSPLARDRAYIDAAVKWLRTPFTTRPRSASTATAPPE
jgi:pimeloyl-ACP methyl ester carboxylesterase